MDLGLLILQLQTLKYLLIFALAAVGIANANTSQDSTGESSFDKFLKRLYEGKRLIQNHPTLEFNYGYSGLSTADALFKSDMAGAYPIGLVYGFTRFDDRLLVDDIFEYGSEYTFLRNITSHFKPDFLESEGITTDTWQFGFGITDGLGYNFLDRRFIMYHSGAFIWTHIDVELYPNNAHDLRLLGDFDREFRFGSYWGGGVKYQIAGPAYLNIGYEHTVVFKRTLFGKFLVSWLVENVSQRWIDFVEYDMMKTHGKNWPWLKFLIKNAISFALYELRRNNMNWPMNTAEPFNFDSFKAGVTFIF